MAASIDTLNQEQKDLLADYWWSRAEGEYTSWIAFKQIRRDLEEMKAPRAVLEMADQAVKDEYRHAEWCKEWAARFGHEGGELVPRTTEALTFRGAGRAEQPILRFLLCCFTETAGCVLLDLVRDSIIDPELREQNHQHLKDELLHSRVGWAEMAALSHEQRTVVKKWAPQLVKELRRIFRLGEEKERPDLQPFGYFPPSVQIRAAEEAIAGVIIPGLKRHDLWGQA